MADKKTDDKVRKAIAYDDFEKTYKNFQDKQKDPYWQGSSKSMETPTSLTPPGKDLAYGLKALNHDLSDKDEKVLGSRKKGGKIRKTGLYRLHKGEDVVPAKKAALKRKSGKR